MTSFKRRTLPAVVAGTLAMGAAVASADQSQQALQAELQTLQAKVAAMEAAQKPRTAEVTATIDAVLKDADRHTQKLAQMATSTGHDEAGFTISADNFRLNASAGMQFRYVANHGTDRKNGDGNDTPNGFEITRARLMLSGHAFDPKMTFAFQWDAGDLTGGTALLDAIVKYEFADQWAVKMGQFVDPVYHENLVSGFNQLAAERSLLTQLIGAPSGVGSRVQGVSLLYGAQADQLHAEVAFTDGFNSANTNFTDGGQNFGIAARAEYKMSGAWADYADMSARSTGKGDDLLVIGAGGDITQGNNLTAYRFTADVQYEMQKQLAVYAAFLGQYADPRNAAGDDSSFNWGFVAQAGYAIDRFEPFARADYTHFENDQANGENNVWELTVGVNYYPFPTMGNKAKFTLDLTWLPNGSPVAAPYQNILGGSDESELILRGQVQLVL